MTLGLQIGYCTDSKKTFSMGKEENIKGFWADLASRKRPFFVLAPMADVTDVAFRQIISKYGKPDVFWTEFVSADGLSSEKGREALMIDLKFSENERPIVAQLFSGNPENMEFAAKLCVQLGFDGIDINMGCPDRSIEKSRSGAYAMKDIKLAKSVVEAARRGAGDIPVSVKTRIGYNKIEWDWIKEVLSWNLPAVTFHLRTRKEMSLVPAHWELMNEIVKLKNEISPETLIIGNGDVKNLNDGFEKIEFSKAEGVMLGRAIFGNPWLFNKNKKEVPIKEKLEVMLEHTKLFLEMLGDKKNFDLMKKHYKAYVNGFDGAKELRIRLMESKTYKEIEILTQNFLKSIDS